jgi:Ca-activated chloride channel family protein
MFGYEFVNKEFFYLFILFVPIIVWYILKQKRITAGMQISSLQGFSKISTTYKYYLRHVVFALRLLALSALIFALARPQSTDKWKNSKTEGIDIIMALDVSTSMLAMDLKPNRLEAAKKVAQDFIHQRVNDRIGIVVFAGESFTQCPLTTDHKVLINLFGDIKTGLIKDGTAIGMGLANSVNRIKDSETKSKIIILLTDGVNNQGDISPLTAAEIAKTYGIRVYTIGVGTIGEAPYPVQTPFGTSTQNMEVKIDEATLKEIASNTNGAYFRATDNKQLEKIYTEIDKLEKSKIDVQEFKKENEEFLIFGLIGLGLFLLEIILKYTVLKARP